VGDGGGSVFVEDGMKVAVFVAGRKGVRVTVGLGVGVGMRVAVPVAVAVTVPVWEPVGVTLAELLGVGESVVVKVGNRVNVAT
jgi:hypothetical protein